MGGTRPMTYQGQQVNFSQSLGLDQLSTIINQNILPRLNTIQNQYPQEINSASAKSDTDIWNNINRYIWGKSGAESSPKGDWTAEPNALFPRVKRNEASIIEITTRDNNLQEQINQAKDERDLIQEELEKKSISNHTHSQMGNPLGNSPLSSSIIPSLSLTTIALGGLAAYLLLGKK